MPVTWTKERYEEGYDGAPEGTLAWPNRRFVWQVEKLIADFGLKPEVDSLVIIGDGWGGVATEFARLGYVLTGSESSQYIIDNWHLYGSPHVTKPTFSDSYTPEARDEVKTNAPGTRSTQTSNWVITCDAIGDLADHELTLLSGLNDYLQGHGLVVHMVTPDSDRVAALADNNWKLWSEWRAALDATPGCENHDVVSLEGWLRQDLPSVAVQSEDFKTRSIGGDWPFNASTRGKNLGPFEINGSSYIGGQSLSYVGPLMTVWTGLEWQEIGATLPTPQRETENLWCTPIGDLIGVTYLNKAFTPVAAYYAEFDTTKGDWGPSSVVSTTSHDFIQSLSLVARSTGVRYIFRSADRERVMGSFYSRMAIFSSSTGSSWSNLMTLNTGSQQSNNIGVMGLGVNDAIHLYYTDEASGVNRLQTLSSSDVLRGSYLDSFLTYEQACPILNGSEMIFAARQGNGTTIRATRFTSSDDPQNISNELLTSNGSSTYWGGVADGIPYLFHTTTSPQEIYLSKDEGSGWVEENLGPSSWLWSAGTYADPMAGYLRHLTDAGNVVDTYSFGEAPPPIEPPDYNALSFQEWIDWNKAIDNEFQEWYGQQNAADPVVFPELLYYYDWRNEWRKYHQGKPVDTPAPPLNQTPPDPYVDPCPKEDWCSYNIAHFQEAVDWYESMTASDPVEYPEIRTFWDWANEFNFYMDRGDMRPKAFERRRIH